MTRHPESQSLATLQREWSAQWRGALSIWSRFVQLHDPTWCVTKADEVREGLVGSFAMIRLNDHSVVVSLRQVCEAGLQRFALEILAHEIGHHVYCPADLTDHARLLVRIRAGLPTKEHLAPFVANLYSDLLINDRLQRIAELDIAGVYMQLGGKCTDPLWTLYMRIYELLWRLPPERLALGKRDQRLNQDAQLGARLVRSYAKDWLDGGGRFAALCLPYLIKDEAEKSRRALAPWLDTRSAGGGALPEGLAEIESQESVGAIHPAEDPELSGVEGRIDDAGEPGGAVAGAAEGSETGVKSDKQYRQPFEYAEVLKAAGVEVDLEGMVAQYYRELAVPHLVPFPQRPQAEGGEPVPEGLEVWDISSPIEEIDWLGTLVSSPQVVPGITTRSRTVGANPGRVRATQPIDLYLGVDCSGSMPDPRHYLSIPVLAGAIIALSALRAGSNTKVVLSGEPGRTVATEGFIRQQQTMLKTLSDYLGTGYAFGIHRLRETFQDWPRTARPVHILLVSDNDMFHILNEHVDGRLGWDVASDSLAMARGGGTMVLQLPDLILQSRQGSHYSENLERLRHDGWDVSIVNSMDELLQFSKRFARASYAASKPGIK